MENRKLDKFFPQKKSVQIIVACVLLFAIILTCVFWPQVHTLLIFARIQLEIPFGTMTYGKLVALLGAKHTAASSSMSYKQWDLPDGRYLWCFFGKPRDKDGNITLSEDNYPDALILLSAEITAIDHTLPY